MKFNNLHILSRTYNELYKCCEEITALYLDLGERKCFKKKNFKNLLKNIISQIKNFWMG